MACMHDLALAHACSATTFALHAMAVCVYVWCSDNPVAQAGLTVQCVLLNSLASPAVGLDLPSVSQMVPVCMHGLQSVHYAHAYPCTMLHIIVCTLGFGVLLPCAQTESGLPCPWLDQFYSPISGPGFAMPHESDIKAFVHSDCSPNPPCACAGVKFDGSDSGEGSISIAAAASAMTSASCCCLF